MEKLTEIRNRNMQLRGVAHLIDQQIYRHYRLWPTNYIAADLLKESNQWEEHYQPDVKEKFLDYIGQRLSSFKDEPQYSPYGSIAVEWLNTGLAYISRKRRFASGSSLNELSRCPI